MTPRRPRGHATGSPGPDALLGALAHHDLAFVRTVRDHLDLPVPHARGRRVHDLVRHRALSWNRRARELDPAHPRLHLESETDPLALLDAFARSSASLVSALDAARGTDAGEATLHRCGAEAAVHLVDAERLTAHSGPTLVDPAAAADGIATALADAAVAAHQPPLRGTVVLCACMGVPEPSVWRVSDGERRGTLTVAEGAPRTLAAMGTTSVVVHVPPSALLAWLWGRPGLRSAGDLDQAHLVLLDAERRAVLARLADRCAPGDALPLARVAHPVGGGQ